MTAPGEADVRALLARTDEVLVGLRAIVDAEVDAPGIEQALGQLSAALYDALAARGSWTDFRDAVDGARAACGRALEALQAMASADPQVGRTLPRVAWILRELAHVRPPILDEPGPIPPPEKPLRATVSRPRLLCPERSAITAAVPLSERELLDRVAPVAVALPPTFPGPEGARAVLARALTAALPDSGSPPPPKVSEPPSPAADVEHLLFGEAIDEHALLLRRARDLGEELGAMGRMRRHDDALPWMHGLETERRLLTRIDALVAIGDDAYGELVRMLEERPMADPELAWALLMLLGSVGGSDTAAAIARLLDVLDLDDPDVEDFADVVADALTHAPHPGVRAVIAPWLESRESVRRRVAHAALGARRELSMEEALRGLGDADTDVVVSSLRAIMGMEGRVVPGVLSRALRDSRPRVVRWAMMAALQHRIEDGLRVAMDRALHGSAAEAGAAMIVAIGGSEPEARRVLLDAAVREPCAATFRALGWYGHLEAFELLVRGLEADEDTARAAWSALERLTGARMTADDLEPEYADDDRPFVRAVGSPTVIPPSEGCFDPEAWRGWIRRHGHRARGDVRYRFGHPWTPADDILEMRHPASTQSARRYLHLELCARIGGGVPFEPHAFVPRQLALVALWDARADDLAVQPGRWISRYTG